jgi:hypothetical protein
MSKHLAYVVLLIAVGCGGMEPVGPVVVPDGPPGCDLWPFYWDRDGDGYGSLIEAPVWACAKNGVPPGMTVGNSDCADHDPIAYPNSIWFHMTPIAGPKTSKDYDWDCNGEEERAKNAGCSVGGCR